MLQGFIQREGGGWGVGRFCSLIVTQARRHGGFGGFRGFGRTAHTQAMVWGEMCGHGSIVRGITSTYRRDLDKVVDCYSHLYPRRFELEQWGSRTRAHPGPGNPLGKHEFKSSLIKVNMWHFNDLSTVHTAISQKENSQWRIASKV